MLTIDKKITPNDLSILIFKDRIAFCTLEQTLYFDLEKKKLNSNSLDTWINYHKIKKKNNKCILFESKGVVVPEELFDGNNKNLYLSLSEDHLKNKLVVAKHIKSDNQVFVFSQKTDWQLLFKNTLDNLEINHFGAELIPFVSKNSAANIKKRVFIHIREDYFDLFIYQGVQLLLFNSFPHKNEEEFLYYLFFVLEQFYLKPNQFTAVFLGKFVKYKKYYEVFNEFHTLTEFILPENSEIDSHHPAPFFNYFYNHEDNFREI